MARPTNTLTTPADDGFNPQRLDEAGHAMAKLGGLQAAYDDDRDLANQLWGQIQMADAISKLTTVVGLTKLKEIKESKLYRAFAGKSAVDREGVKIHDVGNWDGFCRALGTSANKVDEDLLNLRTFGEEAMENLSRIGAGYRELRQYRKLPEDQKLALIEVAKTGDKESFVELAEEIIAKHAKEKEALAQQVEEAKQSLADKDAVIVQKTHKIEELVEDKNRRDGMTEAETFAELERELTGATLVSIGDMQVIRKHIQDIRSLDRTPQGLYIACANALQRIVSEAMSIATDWGIELTLAADLDDDADFDDPNADEESGDDEFPRSE